MSKKAIAIAIAALCCALALPAIAFAWSGATGIGSIAGGRAAAVLEAPDLPTDEAGESAGIAANGRSPYNTTACPGYRDANGNGTCDNREQGGRHRYAPFAGTAACPGYIDVDGDGICDNYGIGGCLHYPERGDGASPDNPGYGNGSSSIGPGRGCGHHGGCSR